MDNQLIKLSLNNLSIEDFDNNSIQDIIINIYISSKEISMKYPFSISNISLAGLLEKKISLIFSYKGTKFGNSTFLFDRGEKSLKKTIKIQSINSIPISPEKQRPRGELDEKDIKIIGQGNLCIDYNENSIVSIRNPTKTLEGQLILVSSFDDHDIALDLTNIIRENGNISAKDAEHFRILIIGLNFKLKTLCLIQSRLNNAEIQSLIHLQSREDIEKRVETTCDSFSNIKNELENEFKNFSDSRNKIQEKLLGLDIKYKEKCIIETKLESKILFQESEIERLKNENKNFEDMQKMIDKLKKDIKGLEADRDVFREDFRKTIKNFEQEINNKDKEISEIADLNIKLERQVSEKEGEIHKLLKICDEKERKINELSSEIDGLKGIVKGMNDLEAKSKKMEEIANKHQAECVNTQNFLEKSCKDFNNAISSLNNEKNSILDKNNKLQQEIAKLKQDLNEKTNAYRSETITSQELRTKSVIIQQKLSNTIDLSKLFEQIKYLSTYSTEISDKMVEDNDELSLLLIKSAQDIWNLLIVIKQIREIIDDRDNEIIILRELIAELQNKTTYYPIKDDPVDEAISEYVNSRSEPMPVLFIREEYGTYLFGTKRVFIKLENNKIISKEIYSKGWRRIYENRRIC